MAWGYEGSSRRREARLVGRVAPRDSDGSNGNAAALQTRPGGTASGASAATHSPQCCLVPAEMPSEASARGQ